MNTSCRNADAINSFIDAHHELAIGFMRVHKDQEAANQYKLLIDGINGKVDNKRLLGNLQIYELLLLRAHNFDEAKRTRVRLKQMSALADMPPMRCI
jgi:hypothetical protein